MHFNKKGIALIATVILIIFASFAVLGFSAFIFQRITYGQVVKVKTECLYLAQAGYNYAIYAYRNSGTFPSGQINIDANNYFVLNVTQGAGTQADNLYVNPSASLLANSNRDVRGVTIKNLSTSSSVTIDRIIVTWSGVPASRRLTQIRINSSTRFNSASGLASPANANLSPDFVLSANTTYPIDWFRFNGSMSGATVYAQFVMSDGSTTSNIRIYPASPAVSSTNYTIKSMGKTVNSNIYRTIQTTYNTATGKVTDYHEISTAVP